MKKEYEPKTAKGIERRRQRKRKSEARLEVEKAAVAAMDASGESPTSIARQLGIDRKQVYRWLEAGEQNQVPEKLIEAAKKGISTILVSKFLEVASYLTDDKLKKLSGAQLVVCMGILADKVAKMGGEDEPQGGVVNINVNDPKPVHVQIEEQITAFQAELARRHAGTRTAVRSGDTGQDSGA